MSTPHGAPRARPRSAELVVVVLVLAAIAGSVDTIGYLELGKIFVAHMSGNTAAAAADLARGDVGATLHRAFPIVVFALALVGGAALSTMIVRARLRSTHAVLFGFEAALLGAALVVHVAISHGTIENGAAVALATAAMAMQSVAVARILDVPVLTTAITGILIKFGERFVAELTSRERPPHERGSAMLFGGVWLSFFLGAAGGGVAAVHVGLRALVTPIVVLFVLVARDVQRPFGASPPGLGDAS